MMSWSPQEWTVFLVAVGGLVTSTIAAIRASQAHNKGQENARKIDANTQITRGGIDRADANAQVAVEAATKAEKAAESVNTTVARKLNGELTKVIAEQIARQIAPVIARMEKVDERLEAVDGRMGEVERYQHSTKHDLRDAMNAGRMKQEVILQMLIKAFPEHAPPQPPEEPPPGVKRKLDH